MARPGRCSPEVKKRAVRIVVVMIVGASSTLAQSPGHAETQTVSVQAGTAYERDGLWRKLFGDAWRDVWSAQITVPVLDLGSRAADTLHRRESEQDTALARRGRP
jgi:hypothetical protein